ncbi:hypothetical protein KC19_4G181900, partial [Ceratodon purpureus]
ISHKPTPPATSLVDCPDCHPQARTATPQPCVTSLGLPPSKKKIRRRLNGNFTTKSNELNPCHDRHQHPCPNQCSTRHIRMINRRHMVRCMPSRDILPPTTKTNLLSHLQSINPVTINPDIDNDQICALT